MELVLSGSDDQGRKRDLYVAAVAGLDRWRDVIGGSHWPVDKDEGFALFLAIPGPTESSELIGDLAACCIEHGLFSMSAWGHDCSRVHDIFDETDVGLSVALTSIEDHPVVMTTWHADESLAESLDYFWDCTFADEGMSSGPVRLALIVGTPSLIDEVRKWAAASPV